MTDIKTLALKYGGYTQSRQGISDQLWWSEEEQLAHYASPSGECHFAESSTRKESLWLRLIIFQKSVRTVS